MYIFIANHGPIIQVQLCVFGVYVCVHGVIHVLQLHLYSSFRSIMTAGVMSMMSGWTQITPTSTQQAGVRRPDTRLKLHHGTPKHSSHTVATTSVKTGSLFSAKHHNYELSLTASIKG